MQIKTLKAQETLDLLSLKLRMSERCFFTRFGDGDFAIMDPEAIGTVRGRSNRFRVTEELHKEIIESFSICDEYYLKGHCANFENEPGMEKIDLAHDPNDKWWNVEMLRITQMHNTCNQKEFLNFCAFHYLSAFYPEAVKGFIDEFIREKSIMFVGCREREKIENIFGKIKFYVHTPETDSYSNIDEWWPHVLENIENVDVLIPCSGFSSRVINKRLWNLDCNVHSIDFGSFIDPACGIINRTWTRYAIPYIFKNFNDST